jgi:hypothetical protein
MFSCHSAPGYPSFDEALHASRDHTDELRKAEGEMEDWRKDKYNTANTIMRGRADFENAFINLVPYMDAGCITARPLTPAKRLAALFRRVGLSHLAITDKDNKFLGLITRRSLIVPPTAPGSVSASAFGSHRSSDADARSSPRALPAAPSLPLQAHAPDSSAVSVPMRSRSGSIGHLAVVQEESKGLRL